MRSSLYFALILIILATCWQVNDALRKKGGGRSGGRSRGGSSSRGWSGKSSSGSSSGKKSIKKTLKKAAVVGAGAYVGYKAAKMSKKFAAWPKPKKGVSFKFNDWNSWREAEGFLCRTSQDCTWIDQRMSCQDMELKFSPSNLWFGGDFASIVGECNCPDGMFWDDDDLTCRDYSSFWGVVNIILWVLLGCFCVAPLCYCFVGLVCIRCGR